MRTFRCCGCDSTEQAEKPPAWSIVAGFYYCDNCVETARCKARAPEQQCFCGCCTE